MSWPYWIASISFLSPLLGWWANHRYHQMPILDHSKTMLGIKLPSVSIIVPARNEEANLQRLLPSLSQIDYKGDVEILVVDDHSTDQTAVVARQHHTQLLSLTDLSSGWLGKPHACHHGATMSKGDWLLFTDADTEHRPESLKSAIEQVVTGNLDGLSCHLQHSTSFIWDSLALTAAFAGLFVGLPRKDRSLNGQYILLRRNVYQDSGGFAAVRQEPLEDLALGHHLSKLGYQVPIYHGNHIATVAMYGTVNQLWQGMARLGSGALHWSGIGNVLTVLLITAVMTPLLVGLLVISGHLPPIWFVITWGVAILGMTPWAPRFGSAWLVLIAPIGALFVQASAMWGLFWRLMGQGITWKGRTV